MSGAFGAAVPAVVEGVSVGVVFAVCEVVFFVVADEVVEGEAVVCGDEVEAI